MKWGRGGNETKLEMKYHREIYWREENQPEKGLPFHCQGNKHFFTCLCNSTRDNCHNVCLSITSIFEI